MAARKPANMITGKDTRQARDERRRFVSKYVNHWNGIRAARELGYKDAPAKKIAEKFLSEPFTQDLIEKAMLKIEAEDIVSRQAIMMGLWRESLDQGKGTSQMGRITALKAMAKIKGMEQPEQKGGAEIHLHFDAQDKDA